MRIPGDLRLLVTVIDNDSAGSAEPVVVEMKALMPFPLRYCIEARRGIPCARNRAIVEALAAEADFLVYVDDDEWVEVDWLEQLYNYALSQEGAVICGRVTADVPKGTRAVMAEFFERKIYKTGTRRAYCATNNVLVPIAVVRDLNLRFDESRPLAGGEDTLFFTEASARGVEILYCAEAVVHEVIPKERISLRWQSRRKFAAGTTQAVQKRACGRRRMDVILSGAAQLVGAAASVPLYLAVGQRDNSYRSWLKVCRSAGLIGGAIGVRSDFYRPTC